MWRKKGVGGTITDTSVNLTAKLSSMGVKAYDSFNRADQATMGTADTGQSWVDQRPGLQIFGNQVRNMNVAAGSAPYVSTVETGISDLIYVQAYFTWGTGFPGLVFRFGAITDYLMLRPTATALELYRYIAGSGTLLGSYSFSPVSGTTYKLKAALNGSTITCYMDDVQRIQATETAHQTNTKHGITVRGNADTSDRIDNFEVGVA